MTLLLATAFATAQDYQWRQRRSSSQRYRSDDRKGVPQWKKNADFQRDVFTFARIKYRSYAGQYGYGPNDKWRIDFPDADLNLSFRLKQLTSLEVDPDGVVLELTDSRLFDYPFIYMIEPGMLILSEEEVLALRRYLLCLLYTFDARDHLPPLSFLG